MTESPRQLLIKNNPHFVKTAGNLIFFQQMSHNTLRIAVNYMEDLDLEKNK